MRNTLVGVLPLSLVWLLLTSFGVAAEPGEQGVTGQVIRLTGNFQPMLEPPDELEPPFGKPPRGKRQVLKAPVHIFKGKMKALMTPDHKHPQLVTVVKPDEKGVFRAPLPPGEYTVVAEIDGRLYLNLYNHDIKTKQTFWGTVQVKPKQWTTVTIEDTSQAAF